MNAWAKHTLPIEICIVVGAFKDMRSTAMHARVIFRPRLSFSWVRMLRRRLELIEYFNSRFRDECLSQHWFASLSHMRSVIDNWRDDCNHHHSTLGYVPPAVFAARWRQLAGAPSQPTASTTMQNLGL